MGTFQVAIDVGDPSGQRFEAIEALVDTGATYTVVPAPLLVRLGVVRHARDVFVLADGRHVELDIGQTWVRVAERAVITLVVFGEPESRPLLGAYTLEGVRLAPDPAGRRLLPVPAMLRVTRPGWRPRWKTPSRLHRCHHDRLGPFRSQAQIARS